MITSSIQRFALPKIFLLALAWISLVTGGANAEPAASGYKLMYVKTGPTAPAYIDLTKLEKELDETRQALAAAGDISQHATLAARVSKLEEKLTTEKMLVKSLKIEHEKREQALADEVEQWQETYARLNATQQDLVEELASKQKQLARHAEAKDSWEAERARLLDRFHQEGLVRRGKTLRETLDQTDSTSLVWSLNDVGLLLLSDGRYPEAEELFRRALVVLDTTVGRSDVATGTILEHLADVSVQKNDLDAAASFYKEAADVFGSVIGMKHPRYANTLNSLANVLRSQKDFEAAEYFYRKSMNLYASRGKRYSADQAVPMHNLGLLMMEQGRMDEAGVLLEQAVQLITRQRGESSASAIMAYRSLSQFYIATGNPEKAASCDTRANELAVQMISQ